MTADESGRWRVDLDNCAREPIHTPGHIQRHGVLLALLPDGTLSHASRDASATFTGLPPLGQRLDTGAAWLNGPLRIALQGMLEDAVPADGIAPLAVQAVVAGLTFDAVLHANAGHVLMEFERRGAQAPELALFAVLTHRCMSRIKGRTDIGTVLGDVVGAVRAMTGFDRVMAYRFHADDSGEVLVEAKADGLEPYAGRRFPASDIPVQARRLYVLNTLRLIADVNEVQIPVDAHDPDAAALDMSQCMLRSVSPVHLEYLRNIDVAASMSVSIVIGGRLWGLIACHHRRPYRVPHAVRMACDVLAQVVAAAVQTLLDRDIGARRMACAGLCTQLVGLFLNNDGATAGARPPTAALACVIANDASLLSHAGRIWHHGLTDTAAQALLQWLDTQADDLVAVDDATALPAALRQQLQPLCGLLALRHDRWNRGWVVLLRNAQVATVIWSGPPHSPRPLGPLGARLTPQGSLIEWQQDVQGSAVPWDTLDLALARQMLDVLAFAHASRAAEMGHARAQLLATLGHDLRGPLHTIGMAAMLLEKGSDQFVIGRRIAATTGRMGRLVAQVLDVSRLHSGAGLGLTLESTDVAAILADIVDESRLSYPAVRIDLDSPAALPAEADPVRLGQVVANLLANARQHGALGQPIGVRLAVTDGCATIVVRNAAAALQRALLQHLFDPMKRMASNRSNPNGLGLGLYIAREAMKEHQGSIVYSHDGTHVVFTVAWPLAQPAPAGR